MTISLSEQINKAVNLLETKYLNTSHENRYKHILGVAKCAKELAIKYDIDEDKAYLAGLMHDYYRYEEKEEMAKLLTDIEIRECEECPILYHAYASSHAYLNLIGNDLEISEAIKYHTFGKVPMTKLGEIILISDYIEETRKYEDCLKCRDLVKRGLFYTAIYMSTLNTINLIKREGLTPHPYQLAVLNTYKEKMQVELLDIVKEALSKVRATDIKIYETKEVSPFYDYIVIASINAVRQSEAVTSYLEEYMENTPYKIRSTEGEGSNWYLVDLNSVILSIFTSEERERMEIDKLYSHLKIID